MDAPRRRHTARWVAGIVLLVAAALVAVLATRPGYSTVASPNASLGKVVVAAGPGPLATQQRREAAAAGAKTITLAGPTLTGQPFDLASYRGRWAVVNFFASWCPPCQQEEPDLVTFAFEHRSPTGTALIGVVVNDAPSRALRYQQQQGATWPVVADANGSAGVDWAVTGQPETFLVAPTGRVVAHFAGPLTLKDLDTALATAAVTSSGP